MLIWRFIVGFLLWKALWVTKSLSELKPISRVEELEKFILNFTVYMKKLTNGWKFLQKCFILCPSFFGSPFLKPLPNYTRGFMSAIDGVLKQCLSRKIESVRIKMNNNLSLRDKIKMEAERGPSVITVSKMVECSVPVICFMQE